MKAFKSIRLLVATLIITASLSLTTFNPTAVVRSAPQTGKNPLALLGLPVRANIGGHMSTIILTDYDLSDDSYWGLAIRNRTMDSSEHAPIFTPVSGLRQYPYSARPDYSFQFVFPGADEQPLIDIANANGANRGPMSTEPHVANPSTDGRPKPELTTPDERKKKKDKKPL